LWGADIVVLGLKLINDILSELTASKYLIFKVCLESIDFYAPASPPHRPRPIPKSRSVIDQLAAGVLELMGGKMNINLDNKKDGEKKGEAAQEGPKKDSRGRWELDNPDYKEILDANIKKKMSTVAAPTVGSQGATTKPDNTNSNNTVLPSIANSRTSTRMTASSPIDDAQQALEGSADDGDDNGYRLVRSINKGHLLSKKEWKGTSGKIGK
jgi:hypothetical protein